MKKFLKSIAIFVIPLFVFFILLENVIRDIPNDFKRKNQYLNQHVNDINVLILGSSHSLSFIKPSLFRGHAFNAANLHQTLKFDEFILNKFIDQMTQLKYVILPISYGSFHASLSNSKDKWRIKNYVLYYDYQHNNPKYKFEVLNGSTSVQIESAIDYITKNKSYISCSERGFGIDFANAPQTDLDKTGIYVARRHSEDCFEENIEENKKSFETILTKCNDRNIKVILYTAPAWKSYREAIKPEILKQTLDITESLANQFDNVFYKSYLSDPRFISDDFRDVDHLNESGAIKFTKFIIQDFNIY